jgi:thioredoxin reductase
VALYEKTDELGGGQFKMATSAPYKENVNILVNHTVQRITEDGVAAVTCEDKSLMIPADFVIVAFGAVPYNPLEEDA